MRARSSFGTLSVIAIFSAIGVACGNGDDGAASPTEAASTEEGKALYLTRCASCHGDDLRGTDQGPSHLSRVYEPNHHGDDAFRSAIANGSPQHHWNFGDMAPVPGLSPAEVDAIIAFVRETQETEGFEG
jgi:mono/diheme cytochrome c family protein